MDAVALPVKALHVVPEVVDQFFIVDFIPNTVTYGGLIRESVGVLLARTMKSWFFLILRILISGSAIITPFFPPYIDFLALISPNALETANFPGYTLNGPII